MATTIIKVNKQNIKKNIHEKLAQTLSDNQEKIIISLAEETQEKIRNFSSFQSLKNQVQEIYIRLTSKTENTLSDFIDAYEIILQARKFFLGEKGTIDYNFLFLIDNEIREVKLDSLTFKKLLLEKGDQILAIQGDDLKFKRAGVISILFPNNVIVNLQQQKQIIKLEDNTQVHIQSANAFQKKLDQIKKITQRFFGFNIQTHITKKSYHFQIDSAFGKAKVKTVYSAVGKYAYDELNAKKSIINQQKALKKLNEDVKDSLIINTGNLSEIYALYKNKYNKGHNHFSTTSSNSVYREVTGQQLFPLFKEVKRNTDAFYQGGDILTEQIKSFLRNAPSLTRLSTLKKQIQKLNNILLNPNKEDIKKSIAEMFIKKKPVESDAMYKSELRLFDQLNQHLRQLTW